MKNLRHLPAVHQLQEHIRFKKILSEFQISKNILTKWMNEQIDTVRNKIKNNRLDDISLNKEELIEFIFDQLDNKIHLFNQDNLRGVINATGVVLHTNLGRARLSKQVIDHIASTASTYSTLEYDVENGKRGSRHSIVEEYIKQVTGAEAAMVVNNNAAAVLLVLKTLASGGEVIVSRGELVEIGGSFRISEIMEESLAELVAVGTTNKSYVSDYERAITENTAILMKVHKSNFKVVGFTNEVDTSKLIKLSQAYNIPIYEDLGSGTLFDFREHGIGDEPTVQEKIKSGIDIISFSGDKLLGGPQAGIIVGKKVFIDSMKKHQLARVLRVDKFTLAGLEATLKSYLKEMEQAEIPTVRDILESKEAVLKKAEYFMEKIVSNREDFTCRIEPGKSKVGGGTMPDVGINTYVVNVKHDVYSSEELARKLRNNRIPVIVRVKNEEVILDFRTVDYEEVNIVIEAFLHM